MAEQQIVVVERELSYPPHKVWRALTQPHLIEEWLVKNNFVPQIGHRFDLQFDWGEVTCQVREIEEGESLSYSWVSGDLNSVVTWTLTPSEGGTLLRMEQEGFPNNQPRYLMGAKAGWPRLFDGIEGVLSKLA